MYVYVHHGHAWSLRSEEDIESPRSGVIDRCELPRGFWEPNPSPQQEWEVLLIICLRVGGERQTDRQNRGEWQGPQMLSSAAREGPLSNEVAILHLAQWWKPSEHAWP